MVPFGLSSYVCHSSRFAIASFIVSGHELCRRRLWRWSRHRERIVIVTIIQVVVSRHRINGLLVVCLLGGCLLSRVATGFGGVFGLLFALATFQFHFLKKPPLFCLASSFLSILDLILTDERMRRDAKDTFIFTKFADPKIFRCRW